MTTASDIIARAYTLLGVKSTGETLSGTLQEDALLALNDMIDAWRNENFFVYSVQETVYQMVPNQQTVTIGPGAQIDVAVPLKIEEGGFCRTGQLDYPFGIANRQQYEGISLKTVGATWLEVVYYDRAYPFGTLFFYPVPAGAYELHLPLQVQLTEFADIATQYTLPPGYRRMFAYSLAEELAGGLRDLDPSVARIAAAARRSIKRANHITPILDIPAPLTQVDRFNIFSGR